MEQAIYSGEAGDGYVGAIGADADADDVRVELRDEVGNGHVGEFIIDFRPF